MDGSTKPKDATMLSTGKATCIRPTTNPDVFLVLAVSQTAHYRPDQHIESKIRFGANKAILTRCSPYFKGMLSGNFTEGTGELELKLKVNFLLAARLVLEVIHGTQESYLAEFKSSDISQIVDLCSYWQVDHKKLSVWFDSWVEQGTSKLPLDILSCKIHREEGNCLCLEKAMLFPAYAFDQKQLFMLITYQLVMRTGGTIKEPDQSEDSDSKMPRAIIQQLNGARGSVRGRLEKKVMECIQKAIQSNCDCKHMLVKGFYQELKRLKLYPTIQLVMIGEPLINVPATLSEEWTYSRKGCLQCGSCFPANIIEACEEVETYFNGLCLDCIARDRDCEDPQLDHNFPPHLSGSGEKIRWSRNCKYYHGSASWFFSFFSRKETFKKAYAAGKVDIFAGKLQEKEGKDK